MRVLLVEDEKTIALTLGDELADAGHEVITVACGATAIRLLQQQPLFDCVITDLRLPGAEGDCVLVAAKAVESRVGRTLPVLVISAWFRDGDVDRLAAIGADDCIQKPFRNDDVVRRVASAVAAASRGATMPKDPRR